MRNRGTRTSAATTRARIAGYPVGRIRSLVQDEDDLLEKLGHNHLLDRLKGPALHAACLRLMRAILSVTGFQYPLTEDAVVDKLRLWALGPDDEGDEDAAVGTVIAAAHDAQAAADAAVAAAHDAEGAPTHPLAVAAAIRAKSEALRVKTYATACLAVALEAEDVASAMVRRGDGRHHEAAEGAAVRREGCGGRGRRRGARVNFRVGIRRRSISRG